MVNRLRSDYSVTSHDPWIGIYALLTRIDQATGKVHGPDETLGIDDALRTYTINGAYLTYDEDWKGSLEAGKVADMVILDLERSVLKAAWPIPTMKTKVRRHHLNSFQTLRLSHPVIWEYQPCFSLLF
ncbi:MAG: amidohydrolase family protein [Balneolales bacterium]